MKLNYDLIREILLTIETISDGLTLYEPTEIYEKYHHLQPKPIFLYHVKYLHDANFIETEGEDYIAYITDITPIGRQYLDAVRSPDIWHKTKDKLSPLGNVTLSVISELATSFIKDSLGIKS